MIERDYKKLNAAVKEAEQLLQFPSIEGHCDAAVRLLRFVGRNAPTALVAERASAALSSAFRCRSAVVPNSALIDALVQLRDALRLATAHESMSRKRRPAKRR